MTAARRSRDNDVGETEQAGQNRDHERMKRTHAKTKTKTRTRHGCTGYPWRDKQVINVRKYAVEGQVIDLTGERVLRLW